jgi:hypothetical protein
MPAQEAGKPKRPSGPDCTPAGGAAKLHVYIQGLPREHCGAHGLRVKLHVVHEEKLSSVVVRVNGRKVRKTKRGVFILRIGPRRLRNGTNKIVVSARDARGNTATRSARFRRC